VLVREALVTAESWDPGEAGAPGRGHLRASDADRERVIDALKTAFVQGRLTWDELGHRTGKALVSRTYAELTALTADIPRPSPARPRSAPARPPGRVDKKTVAWVICMLLMPVTLGAAFLTYQVAFLFVFVFAFIGVTVTAQL
jgi:hypothetical protein